MKHAQICAISSKVKISNFTTIERESRQVTARVGSGFQQIPTRSGTRRPSLSEFERRSPHADVSLGTERRNRRISEAVQRAKNQYAQRGDAVNEAAKWSGMREKGTAGRSSLAADRNGLEDVQAPAAAGLVRVTSAPIRTAFPLRTHMPRPPYLRRDPSLIGSHSLASLDCGSQPSCHCSA